jgi:hypothetical protein
MREFIVRSRKRKSCEIIKRGDRISVSPLIISPCLSVRAADGIGKPTGEILPHRRLPRRFAPRTVETGFGAR